MPPLQRPFASSPHPVGAIVVVCLLAAGCGGRGDIGRVSGTVTLDGAPLAEALVTFQPTAGGPPSRAWTDASGRYELRYSRTRDGAKEGDHEVTITTLDKGNPDADPPRPPRPEQVPDCYNRRTTLTAHVVRGGSRIDFQLTGSTARSPAGAVRR